VHVRPPPTPTLPLAGEGDVACMFDRPHPDPPPRGGGGLLARALFGWIAVNAPMKWRIALAAAFVVQAWDGAAWARVG
jgi:hypothetical protein